MDLIWISNLNYLEKFGSEYFTGPYRGITGVYLSHSYIYLHEFLQPAAKEETDPYWEERQAESRAKKKRAGPSNEGDDES